MFILFRSKDHTTTGVEEFFISVIVFSDAQKMSMSITWSIQCIHLGIDINKQSNIAVSHTHTQTIHPQTEGMFSSFISKGSRLQRGGAVNALLYLQICVHQDPRRDCLPTVELHCAIDSRKH